MRIEAKSEGEALVVAIRDSHLGADTVAEFKQLMMEELSPETHTVLLEMSEVPFVDSTGLGALVAIRGDWEKTECWQSAVRSPACWNCFIWRD